MQGGGEGGGGGSKALHKLQGRAAVNKEAVDLLQLIPLTCEGAQKLLYLFRIYLGTSLHGHFSVCAEARP